MSKQMIFSGAQPSGALTIGNYFGALKNWAQLQDDYTCLYCIVDLHAITVRQEPEELRKRTRDVCMQYIAAGLDPEKSTIFIQSHVSGHAELAWVLNCFSYMGELSRMTQFKEKSTKHNENINAGLFTYPILMAADILLYNADLVPVGEDQRQHLELCRNLAERFNQIYGDVFTVPEGYFPKVGARIMSLAQPENKMSKSDENVNGVIFLQDAPDVIVKKIKRAVTDSDNEVRYSPDKPGVSNLITLYCCATGKTTDECVAEFQSSGYGAFKSGVAEAVVEALRPFHETYKNLSQNPDYMDKILKENAQKARAVADKTLQKVHHAVGFLSRV